MIVGGIIGPTASGKSDLAIDLAQSLGAEIINADSRQIFKNFIVGTAQPTVKEQKGVRHHLLNFAEPDEEFSAGAFQKAVHRILEAHPEKKFLIVGGTGFYFKTLLEGMSPVPEIASEIRTLLQQELERIGGFELHRQLREIDTKSFMRLDFRDTQRVLRAHEVYRATGQSWSSFDLLPKKGKIDFPLLVIHRARDELYQRINQRCEKMLEGAWQEEVRRLLDAGVSPECRAMKSLGYPEVLQWVNGNSLLEDVCGEISQKTRRYAKRQITYYRHQFEGVNKLEVADPKCSEVLKFLK